MEIQNQDIKDQTQLQQNDQKIQVNKMISKNKSKSYESMQRLQQQSEQYFQKDDYQMEQQSEQDKNEQNSQILEEKSKTYYYSNFDLFGEANRFTFLKYQKFIKKMKQFLGADWHVYASQLCYVNLENNEKSYWNEIQMFDLFLEIWLELRNQFHKKRKNSTDEKSLEEDIKFYEENGMYQEFTKRIRNKLEGYLIEEWSFNPVANGFFLASVTVWNETLNELKNFDLNESIISIKNEIEQTNQISRKSSQQSEESPQQIMKQKIISTVQSTIAYTQNYKVVKPLMVATEKILKYLNKNVKIEESNQNQENEQNLKNQQKLEDLSEKQLENFSNFKSNIFQEEEVVLDKLKNLKLQEDEQIINRKRRNSEINKENTNVEIKQISQKEDKNLQEVVLAAAQDYLKHFKQTTQDKWQIARGFVTNIIELNNSMLQKTINLPYQVQQNINIRFLQPAHDFYNHLLEIWILFKNKQNGDKNFQEFLEKVKQSFGPNWNEKLIVPTKQFFKTLVNSWEKLISNKEMANMGEQEIAKEFIKSLNDNMHQDWDNNVVSQFKNIQNQQKPQQ